MRKVALFGGSFNPIHLAHLSIAKSVYSKLDLNEVWFIPSIVHPFKGKIKNVSISDRLNMIELAIQDFPYFKLNTVELDFKLSYTIDTISFLKKTTHDTEFYLIIGGDNASSFKTWHKYEEICKEIKIIVYKRDDFDNERNLNFQYLDVPYLDISSTTIREIIFKGNDVKNMLPEKVFNYILRNKLYQS